MRALRQTFRTLFRTPFVTTVAILSLALGIGANTAIFSLFEQFLLRPLPVQEPDRLVYLTSPGRRSGAVSCNRAGDCDAVFSYAMYRDLESARSGFAGMAAHRLFSTNLAYRGQTISAEGMYVSGSYFPLLGLRPALGRLLGPQDDQTLGGHFVAVVSYSFWQTQSGANPDVVGTEIVVNGRSMTIVGVAPKGFEGTTLSARPRIYVPISMRGALEPSFNGYANRRNYWIYIIARLADGQTPESAEAAINTVYRPIINEVEAPLNQDMSEQQLARFRAREIVLEDARRGQSSVHREVRTPLLLLFATTGIVLLIACANIANLLLARGANRSMEMAVRLSLGAGRSRIMGQLLLESVMLALLGGIASFFIAGWTLRLVASILPPDAAPLLRFELRPAVMLFAAGLSVFTGVLFGLFPALHSTRTELVSTIRANAGNIASARSATRFRAALVSVQIALSMMLLATAGLFLKSLVNVGRVELGLDVDQLVTFTVAPQLNGYEPERSKVLFANMEQSLAAIPGVVSVTSGMVPLLSGSDWWTSLNVQGFERGPDTDANSAFNEVGPGFFQTLGIPVLAGRDFTVADAAGTLRVAIVNEAFAEKFGLGRDAVGKWMSTGDTLDTQIIGLVRNSGYSEVRDEMPPVFYTPWRQSKELGHLSFYLRTAGDPRGVLRAIPEVVRSLDPNLPVVDLKTMPQQVRENVMLDRLISLMSGVFALLATILAAVGLYGVLAYTVTQRTREIGVQMALGADGRRVRLMVMRQVLRLLAVGGIVGILAALAVGRAARSLLFGLTGHDPFVLLGAAAVLTAFALLAGYLPALRASRIDPMRALRYE